MEKNCNNEEQKNRKSVYNRKFTLITFIPPGGAAIVEDVQRYIARITPDNATQFLCVRVADSVPNSNACPISSLRNEIEGAGHKKNLSFFTFN